MTTVIACRYVIAFFLMLILAYYACFVVGLFLIVTGLDLLILWRP